MIRYYLYNASMIACWIFLMFNIKNLELNDAFMFLITVILLISIILIYEYWFENKLSEEQQEKIEYFPTMIFLKIISFFISLKYIKNKNIYISKEQIDNKTPKRKLNYYIIQEERAYISRVKEYKKFISYIGLYLLISERSVENTDLIKCIDINNQIKSIQTISKFKL